MKKYDFLIMYEVTVRELESIILLGSELERRGYTVGYFSFEHCNLKKYLQNKKEIRKYYNQVEVVLTPSLYHDTEVYNLVHYVCGDCKNIVNLRWEQVFNFKTEADYDCYQYPHGDARKAYHLCWGKASLENMHIAGIDKSKLLLCGPIHMDFLRNQFKDYYYDRKKLFGQYDLPVDRKTVLFISSFAIASRTERQMKLEEASAGTTLFESEAVRREGMSRKAVLEWIEALLKEESCTFIYRPHPVENVLGDLEDLQKKYRNFRVISEHSVKQWLLCCDVVTTWVSTSIVEAYFAGKSCLIMRPYSIEKDKEMCVYERARFIETKENFLAAVNEEVEMSVSEEVIRRHYDFTDRPSYIRFADSLEAIYANQNDRFPWDKAKIQVFDSQKWKYVLQSMVIFIYLPVINFMGVVREKTGMSWGVLNNRVDSYRKAKKMRHKKLASEDTMRRYSERIGEFI